MVVVYLCYLPCFDDCVELHNRRPLFIGITHQSIWEWWVGGRIMLTSYSPMVQKKIFLYYSCSFFFFSLFQPLNRNKWAPFRVLRSSLPRRKGARRQKGRELKREFLHCLGSGSKVARSQHGGSHSGGLLWESLTGHDGTEVDSGWGPGLQPVRPTESDVGGGISEYFDH